MSAVTLETRGLTKAFGANTVVSNLSLEVTKGSLHCIIGPNGAGKTTLFNLLTRDLQPSAGSIRFDGRDVTALRPHDISRLGVGRTYQITSVFADMTVHDNIWVASYRHLRAGRLNFWRRAAGDAAIEARTRSILDRLGLAGDAGRLARELSYGEQRVLEIAITLSTAPQLLLLDEPMSGLSGEDTRRIAGLVRELAADHTVLMIEHKMDVVMTVSDRITVMNFGEIIADGTPAEIAADATVREAYFGAA